MRESWLAELERESVPAERESWRESAQAPCSRGVRLCVHACVHVREGLLSGRGGEEEAVLRVTLGCC